ncbi:MAG: sugar transferase [Ruminococcaceae bacterium]|nr:sugar transferase [Oscillospiraceae bacterium]
MFGIPAGCIVGTLKRLLDLVGALVGCVFLGILTVVVGPMIKLESPGPIFFAQKRVGRNGRIFKMYKFRSMYADAEERKKELMAQNEMNGLMFKMENDPRITKTGAFLRKTSLDEFPQFINILKGDMSFIGPRPDTPIGSAAYTDEEKIILTVRPGITGYNQAINRNSVLTKEKLANDIYYVRHLSLWFDIKIIFMTLMTVLKRKNVNRDGANLDDTFVLENEKETTEIK